MQGMSLPKSDLEPNYENLLQSEGELSEVGKTQINSGTFPVGLFTLNM